MAPKRRLFARRTLLTPSVRLVSELAPAAGTARLITYSLAVKPMPRRFAGGGFMSSQIAESMAVIASS